MKTLLGAAVGGLTECGPPFACLLSGRRPTSGGRAVPVENPSLSASSISFLICIMGPASAFERSDWEGSQTKAAGTQQVHRKLCPGALCGSIPT